MRHAFEIDGVQHETWLGPDGAEGYLLHAADRVVPVALTVAADGGAMLTIGGTALPVVIAQRGDEIFVHVDGMNWCLRHRHPLDRAHAHAHAAGDDEIRAPMPGTVVSVAVQAGERVPRGATLLVIESMKLETTITATRDATIATLRVAPGQAFDRDTLLATLEPPEAEQ